MKRTKLILFILLLIILINFTLAKYIQNINGNINAQIAQFNFIVTGQSYSEENGIIFATTRKDSNTKVASDILAPGTYGEIPININASETKTFLEYTINISLKNKPENLKFYYDENKTLEINIDQIDHYNSLFSKKGFLSFEDNDLSRIEKIYWKWPIESGNTTQEIMNNDLIDSAWMDTIMTMSISVTGKQAETKPMYYASNYGDKVNYKINNEEIIHGMIVNKYADIVEIMPIDENDKAIPTTELVYLGGADGWNNSEKELNLLAKRKNAKRALTTEDILRLYNGNVSYKKTTKKYTTGSFIVNEYTMINDTIPATSLTKNNGKKIIKGDIISIGDTISNYTINSITVSIISPSYSNVYLNQNFDKSCWLTTQYIYFMTDTICQYNISKIGINNNNFILSSNFLFNSNNETSSGRFPIIPVYSISSEFNIKQDNNTKIWNVNY